MTRRARRRRPSFSLAAHHYPRMVRVNELLREVLADAIEREAASDARLELATVTAVRCDPDLRHATVLLASLPGPARTALVDVRPRLQAAIAREVRIKRTPQLSFDADPAVASGERVESILRRLRSDGELPGPGGPEASPPGPVGRQEGT
ncbi:MAG: ribosome-binding factor A [Acidimicrobiales bacterium]